MVSPAPTGVGLTRHRITPDAARTIDGWAWGLSDGTVRLWQLPDALCTFYAVAYADGRASMADEVNQARHEADRLWLLALPEDDRRAYLLDRLDRAADLANRPDVDDILDETWRIYCASLDNIREPVTLTTTEHGKKAAA